MRKLGALGLIGMALSVVLIACGGEGGGAGPAAQKQMQYVKAFNTDASDNFGSTVAISGDGNTMAVGAYAESSATTTINGNMADNGASVSGAVYIYVRDAGGAWQQQAYLKASNAEAIDLFGCALGISNDGNTVAVGARGEDGNSAGGQGDNSASYSGAVYIFSRSGGAWSQQAYLKASNVEAFDDFGYAVTLSGDGNTLAVGARYEDSSGAGATPQADNSVVYSGAVYVFTRSSSTWSQQAYLKSSNTGSWDVFGYSVSLSSNGNTLAVGAYHEDSNAAGVNGNQSDNSYTDSGAVYLFTRSSNSWTQQAYLKSSNTNTGDYFGSAVSLSGDGQTLAVGAYAEASNSVGVNGIQSDNSAPASGAVYVFTLNGGTWSQQAYLKSSNTATGDNFGFAVRLSHNGNALAVGAPGEMSDATGLNGSQTNNSLTNAGAAYLFSRSGSAWTQTSYVKASNTDAMDYFGCDLSLTADGGTLAVGAYGEGSAATGVGGDQADNSAANAGAVYVY